MEVKRKILLNPGPATTTNTVKYSQVVPDICPREKQFGKVMEFVSKKLTEFVGSNEKYTTVLFGGSGTAAVESVISSVIDNNEAVLIINNGAYGKRMCEIADIYKIKYVEFKASKVNGINLEALDKVIELFNNHKDQLYRFKDIIEIHNINDEKIKHLAVVHHETTTGILNDIESIGDICRKYNIDMIVDAMSSFAGIPINMDKMNIKYLISSSNKCIQGMAGVSFVIANKKSLDCTKDIPERNLYLNLYKQYLYFKDNYQMRFTPPVQVLYALKQAIIEAEKEGIENRNKRYRECCQVLWSGLDKLNLERLIDDNKSSMLLTTVIEPELKNYNFKQLHDFLYDRGFTIYPGKILMKNTFRIANIGDIYPEDIENFIKELTEYFSNL